MTKLQPLIQKRDSLTSQLEKFDVFLSSENVDIDELSVRLDKIEKLIDLFEETQLEIEILSKDTNENQFRTEFEDMYYRAVARARKLLSKQSFKTDSNSLTAGKLSTDNVKLPTIELPIFVGSYQEWTGFYDIFNALIHSNDKLTNTQKFYYLKSSLKGDACQVISQLEVSDINYNIAWELLRERYENKRMIIHNHIKSLFELDNANKDSHISLRKLLDGTQRHLRALESLGQPTHAWDSLVIFLISNKLDFAAKREWELSIKNNELPGIKQFFSFLTRRCQILETLPNSSDFNHHKRNKNKSANSFVNNLSENCPLCRNIHYLFRCDQFLKSSPSERTAIVRKLKLCLNCFKGNHFLKDCKSRNCKYCDRKHNSLLHQVPIAPNQESADEKAFTEVVSAHTSHKNDEQVLLSTAIVYIADDRQNLHKCRALLDNGSQTNFITAELRKRLNLETMFTNISVKGVNNNITNVINKTQTSIKSRYNDFKAKLNFLVVPKITGQLPNSRISSSSLNIPQHIFLADPNFNRPGKIDILLGANIFYDLLCPTQIRPSKNQPILQKTQLGWVVAGPVLSNSMSTNTQPHCYFIQEISDNLKRFWKIEESPSTQQLTHEEKLCEEHFKQTTRRLADGRFVVQIPFKDNINQLGNSRKIALKRFLNLERKFETNLDLKQQYKEFIDEYIELGHMEPIEETKGNKLNYYLPHHAVFKESETTKIRVVFDGSAKTSSGLSFNDTQMVGPTIQDDLLSIILRFRIHKYILIADIAKMYRQVHIAEEHKQIQRILWRANPSEEIKCYSLKTVTYGTASAPYLAVRCLQELGHQCKESNPKVSRIILKDFYVDDCITGCNSVDEAIQIKHDLTEILKGGGFELRKWNSNNKHQILNVNNKKLSQHEIVEKDQVKTLGLVYNSNNDTLQYISKFKPEDTITKRTMLSKISQIYDPLGLLGPIIITAKVLLQRLWCLGLDWDESVSNEVQESWNTFYNNIDEVDSILIPRLVLPCTEAKLIQLHGFSDASERAYGACIYLRSIDQSGNVLTSLLCAKSRVAPLKQISLPRLELCGSLLLAQLYKKIKGSMDLLIPQQFFWCDSTVALAWIKGHPSDWKTFVGNRVAEITELTNPHDWYHIRSTHNPADIISRGLNPSKLKNCELWWNGPSWLQQDSSKWPLNRELFHFSETPERKIRKVYLLSAQISNFTLIDKYSSLHKLRRTLAYILRFITNCKKVTSVRYTGELQLDEIQNSMDLLAKLTQRQYYNKEINCLISGKPIPKNSNILGLTPFLDERGVLRVGGRLKNSILRFEQKHPVIIPGKSTLSKLIIKNEHHKQLHAGTQLLLATIQNQYWITSAKGIVKRVLRECMTCFRANPKTCQQIMGNLPKPRVIPDRPFATTGIDYAGPFNIKNSIVNNRKIIKSYLCIFVCFVTKAVHLELVSDLSTASFLNALKRFVSRRGKCHTIFSDNGTNFVGANNELLKLHNLSKDMATSHHVINEGIRWNFIPSRSPHFGGLWEAGVKSVKYHLKRVLGNTLLTYEQLYTILTQIEACINSRPLSQISNDPNDFTCLTPGHFLIGDSLQALPEQMQDNNISRLTKFQQLLQLRQNFWKRWSNEYLTQLHNRIKWKLEKPSSLRIGQLVVLKEENAPPIVWKMGRIAELHPGNDGYVRVVSVRTSNGSILKRAITKICPLPDA